jgi:hypothetical protein
VTTLHVLILVGFGVGAWCHRLALVHLRTGPKASGLLAIFGVLVWGMFYVAALQAHRDASSIFRTVTDLVMPAFSDWLAKVKAPLDSVASAHLERVNKALNEPLT